MRRRTAGPLVSGAGIGWCGFGLARYLEAVKARIRAASAESLEERLRTIDWNRIEESLWNRPYARTPVILTPENCTALVALYDDDRLFRSRVEMERHRFGVGDYKYFAAPLPPLVQRLRSWIYPPLAGIANRWMEASETIGRTIWVRARPAAAKSIGTMTVFEGLIGDNVVAASTTRACFACR